MYKFNDDGTYAGYITNPQYSGSNWADCYKHTGEPIIVGLVFRNRYNTNQNITPSEVFEDFSFTREKNSMIGDKWILEFGSIQDSTGCNNYIDAYGDHRLKRAVSTNFVHLKKGTEIKANDGFLFTIYKFSKNDYHYIGVLGNCANSKTIDEDCYGKILISNAIGDNFEEGTTLDFLLEQINFVGNNKEDIFIFRPISKLFSETHLIAHKGGNFTTLNSMDNFRQAVLNGYKVVETDIHFTSDSIPVLSHDPTFEVDGVTHTIANETLEQLLSVKSNLATLEEFLIFIRNKNIIADLDYTK